MTTLEPDAWARIIYQDALKLGARGWDTTSCRFDADGYHGKPGYACCAPTGDLTSHEVTVIMTQVAGDPTSFYGLVLRHFKGGTEYQFAIDSAGTWVFGALGLWRAGRR